VVLDDFKTTPDHERGPLLNMNISSATSRCPEESDPRHIHSSQCHFCQDEEAHPIDIQEYPWRLLVEESFSSRNLVTRSMKSNERRLVGIQDFLLIGFRRRSSGISNPRVMTKQDNGRLQI